MNIDEGQGIPPVQHAIFNLMTKVYMQFGFRVECDFVFVNSSIE
jgi:hypothetical protein